jgi:hypothetical protein
VSLDPLANLAGPLSPQANGVSRLAEEHLLIQDEGTVCPWSFAGEQGIGLNYLLTCHR